MSEEMSIKVYFLDDEMFLGDIFQEFLESENIEVQTFTEAESAIAQCKVSPPDIMFIDYRLPTMNGEQVAQAIDSDIIKVMVTGELAVSVDYPFKKIITKPYRLQELKELILDLVSTD